jgi:preprotein translocase subunit SecF
VSWDIVGKRKWFLVLSALLLIPGIISLLIPPGLTLGLEFSSGSALEVRFDERVQFTESEVRVVLESMGHPEAIIQVTGDNGLLIRTETLREAVGDLASEQSQIRDALNERIGPITSEGFSFESVSPLVARETVVKTIWASIAAAIGILVYVTWAFRNVPNPVRYGLAAIVALVHDVVIVIGIFSILGKALGVEVDVIFMVGLLTIAGYSVNDTIVVFDRIRENVARSVNQDRPLATVINTSLLESMARSLNTSLTTMLVIVALLLIGGSTIRPFLLVLACGVVVGTYSSMFVASQFLVMWDRGELRRLLPRRRQAT